MIDLKNTSDFNKFVKDNKAALIYVSTPQCNVCKVLKPKLVDFINAEFPKITMGYVDSEALPEVAAQNSIFAVPTILVYLDGKEFLRKSRNINLHEFRQELERPYHLFFNK